MLALQHNSLEGAMLQSSQPGERDPSDPNAEQGRSVGDMPPPPLPTPASDDLVETRSARSASSASRNTNRLSLTLPVAPPTSFPSRPTPIVPATSSYPPTPLGTPSLTSPVEPSDFITAIAAQERRVLELREELSRADSELTRLKKQWASHEAQRKRAEIRNVEPLRPVVSTCNSPSLSGDDEGSDERRSAESDRRRSLLLAHQQSQQGTPTQGGGGRRRVFRGGHTRTLSLLSPVKMAADGAAFEVHEDADAAPASAARRQRHAPSTPATVAKRASWAPRSTHQQASGVKQIAEDLKAGLWTFVEDLRQATVGDEAASGEDRDGTIRASGTPRLRAAAAFEDTPTPPSRFGDVDLEVEASRYGRRTATRARPMKRFSWTPLTVETYDDGDWSNWDSPTVYSNSPRWSGTTVDGGESIPAIPEKTDENDPPVDKQSSPTRAHQASARSGNKLEELLPPMLNRLTPSNLKRTATDFMKEWERSLATPPLDSVLSHEAILAQQ